MKKIIRFNTESEMNTSELKGILLGNKETKKVKLESVPVPAYDFNGYDYVDLGGDVYWATVNIGATQVGEFGGYYAWGETSDRSSSSTSPSTLTKYKYYNGTIQIDNWSSRTNYSKYSMQDGITKLDLEDDVAHAIMGGDWLLPTQEDADWMLANTTKSIKTIKIGNVDYTCSEITSKVNGNKIILPHSGRWGKDGYNYQNMEGYYMLNECSNQPNGWWDEGCYRLCVTSSNYTKNILDRYYLISARGVVRK